MGRWKIGDWRLEMGAREVKGAKVRRCEGGKVGRYCRESRVEGREPRLWEEPRKTTVSSPVRAARLAGRQVPSIERRRAVMNLELMNSGT